MRIFSLVACPFIFSSQSLIYHDLEDVTICKKLTNKTTGSPVTDVISFSINVVYVLELRRLFEKGTNQKNVVKGVADWLRNDS